MHVLMVCALDVWALPGSGGAPTLERTLRAYAERSHRVTYVAPTIGANAHLPGGRLRAAQPSTPPEIPGVTYERFHLPSLQESRLPLPGALRKADQKLRFALMFPMLAARRAERVLDREAVDVLYAYEVHGALAARRLRRRWKGPVVARFQGTVLRPAFGSPLARLRKYEEVRALRLPADLYIMTNDGTQGDEVLARLNPQWQDKVRFWRNGLDLDRLRPVTPEERLERKRALDIPSEVFVMITASRLATWKRVDRAVRALPQIVRDVPSALLLIVGEGEERDRLEALSRELGVIDHVRFAGAVAQDEVVRYMQAADVLLAPADLSNVGNPLLEAMTCGLAIVTVDAGDTGELIRDGETGRLLPDGAPAGIARAAIELARVATLRERLGAGARRYAEANFWTWDARLAAEIDEVERLVGVRAPNDVAAARAGRGGR